MVKPLKFCRRFSPGLWNAEEAEDRLSDSHGGEDVVGAVSAQSEDHERKDFDDDEDRGAGLTRNNSRSKALHLEIMIDSLICTRFDFKYY